MAKLILILSFVFFSPVLVAQTRVDSLVTQGIAYYNKGEFSKAIEFHKQAATIDPNSALVNSEMAMTYLSLKDYDNAILHSDKVIALNGKYLLSAYLTKGSSLDNMGKTEESIGVFENGIKQFGGHYLLYYNLAFNLYKIKNYDKAEEALINGIRTKSNHASSHLLLGYVMADQHLKSQSLLSLHYFLFLEPDSERAKTAFALLKNQFGGDVKRDDNKPNQVNIFLDPNESGDEFGPADLMISMLAASKSLDENKAKTESALFIENTASFFKVLGELKKKKNKGLWWDFYIPFYYDLAKSEHIDTYCYFISKSTNTEANQWINSNPAKVEKFNTWIKKRQN
jgi:hypothetical protein